VPDGSAPVLVTRFTLADGTRLMPLAFIRDVRVADAAGVTTVTYRQTEMDRMGRSGPARSPDDDPLVAGVPMTVRYSRVPSAISIQSNSSSI
jgi:hypothetical protein